MSSGPSPQAAAAAIVVVAAIVAVAATVAEVALVGDAELMAGPATADAGIEKTVLPSGVRVVTERMPEATSVTLGVWVGVGSRDESDELAGASHFLEHLLFKGTADRSARSIAVAIDAAAAR